MPSARGTHFNISHPTPPRSGSRNLQIKKLFITLHKYSSLYTCINNSFQRQLFNVSKAIHLPQTQFTCKIPAHRHINRCCRFRVRSSAVTIKARLIKSLLRVRFPSAPPELEGSRDFTSSRKPWELLTQFSRTRPGLNWAQETEGFGAGHGAAPLPGPRPVPAHVSAQKATGHCIGIRGRRRSGGRTRMGRSLGKLRMPLL